MNEQTRTEFSVVPVGARGRAWHNIQFMILSFFSQVAVSEHARKTNFGSFPRRLGNELRATFRFNCGVVSHCPVSKHEGEFCASFNF
mmetsp:Transcript_74822/g.208040  ORF Transcript_74822/g.208040 Transcript_74822/m.208040 type:complete len:87 (-) Transcript_74822:95-355(-)